MAEAECQSKPNGFSMSDDDPRLISIERMEKEETLYGVLKRIVAAIFFPDLDASSLSLFQRLRSSFADNRHSLKQASKNSPRKLIKWTRRGGPLRSLLVISVGMITLVALTGIIVFMLFFLAATANAIIISLLISMAAAGGFLAIFFACLTGIYIVAMSVAVFVISVATISTVIAIMIATGWIGFFWIVWLSVSKSFGFTKHSLAMTGSAISAYSAALHAHRHRHTE